MTPRARRRDGQAVAVVSIALPVVFAVVVGVVVAASAATGSTTQEAPALPPDVAGVATGVGDAEVAAGRRLYEVGCTTCHGFQGQGTPQGPSLIGVGAASADFYLSTGRMPLDRVGEQAERKPPAYSPPEIRQLTSYVASLGPGPPIPDVDLHEGDLALGGRLYADNCAPCHSSAGAGGALGHAVYAPKLKSSTPTQVAEAIRIGPGAMPRFGPETFGEHQLASVVRYVEYLRSPDDRGGLGLGHLGPLPEGFVAWVVGLGVMLLIIRWIGTAE